MQFRSIGWYTTKSQIAESDAGQAARRLQSHRKGKEKEKVEKRVVAMCNAPYKRAHAPIEGKTGKRRKEITSSYANDSDRRSKRQERRT